MSEENVRDHVKEAIDSYLDESEGATRPVAGDAGPVCIDAVDEVIMCPRDDVEVRRTDAGTAAAVRSDAAIVTDVAVLDVTEVR
ncbi:hypothetical protein [Halosimplex pelagicum]|uniref:Uncharacterized protein n=1 Tax=Halosimplex pelagicum TaxID=869886 RepID=A0A7D5TUK1_9EURY|nr:hypothetical protein [Halosimplex pelagicum]QLH82434.1 hypothetical protein HZS54_12770 [Halosimplex pelagicum]QLH82490.1 hypothetical protein HZS54_13075 [Halosimplex pelagicum]